jgi:branched-chain amino acid aminotransferase
VSYLCHNGKFLLSDEPVLPSSNRSYRYGDGLFETIRVRDGKILLAGYHFERLFNSFSILKFTIASEFTAEHFIANIAELCRKNGCDNSARVRLSVSRGNGSLQEKNKRIEYIIESTSLAETNYQLNENGLSIDIYPDARKSCDVFANLKSANYLPYVMAADYASQHKLDDSLVLNMHGNIADSSIANIFIIKNQMVLTPSLEQGCVAGVMRRYLIERLQVIGHKVQEVKLSIADLETADEVFLTNAIRGIQWVKSFRDEAYKNEKTREIFENWVKTIQPDQSSNLGFTKLFSFDPKR